jgi:hypothetical protein
MAEPLLTDIFGASATQDATHIHIKKSDLPMTAAAVNGAEQILAAVVKKASSSLTAAAFASNPDQSISIAPGHDQLVYRTIAGINTAFLQSALTCTFAKIQPTNGITPDDYSPVGGV